MCVVLVVFSQFDTGQFVNYEQSLNDKLEHASRSGTDQVSFSTANNSYIVLLSRQRQYNEKTMKSREIRHVSGSVPAVGASVPQAANKFNHTFSPIQSGVLKHTMTVSVLGLSGADVQSFQTKFHKTISKSMEKPKKVCCILLLHFYLLCNQKYSDQVFRLLEY